METFHPLTQPVGAALRNAEAIELGDSLARAAWVLREGSSGLVPVVENGVLRGAITEKSLGEALSDGLDIMASAESSLVPNPPTIPAYASGSEALRRLAETESPELIVVDHESRYMGVLSAADLFPRPPLPPILPTIGGMATPFGVYLTSAGIRAGAGHLALVSTGMLLGALLIVADLASFWIANELTAWITIRAASILANVLPFVLFLIGMRLMPLSGTHASEHKVVHAMERGEPLELEVVRRMPRVHPRCGTNIAVGATLFLGLAGWHWMPYEEIRLMVASLVTLFVWRPIGSLVQQYVTTKPPTDAQLQNGIRAGRELIEKVLARRRVRRSFWERLVASGLFHVMGGSSLVVSLYFGLSELFGWRLPL